MPHSPLAFEVEAFKRAVNPGILTPMWWEKGDLVRTRESNPRTSDYASDVLTATLLGIRSPTLSSLTLYTLRMQAVAMPRVPSKFNLQKIFNSIKKLQLKKISWEKN